MKMLNWMAPLGLLIVGLVLVAVAGADDKKEEKTIKTDSGLQYVDLKEGTGEAAKKGDEVEVFYTGWLKEGGKKFDSNVGKKPFPVVIGAGKVIKGWDEGLVGIKVGGKRKLMIPPELGYGKEGYPGAIPGNADLVFEVELVKIK